MGFFTDPPYKSRHVYRTRLLKGSLLFPFISFGSLFTIQCTLFQIPRDISENIICELGNGIFMPTSISLHSSHLSILSAKNPLTFQLLKQAISLSGNLSLYEIRGVKLPQSLVSSSSLGTEILQSISLYYSEEGRFLCWPHRELFYLLAYLLFSAQKTKLMFVFLGKCGAEVLMAALQLLIPD